MTAKAMAHMDKASIEQRALINKLADEYADELQNLGVRVSQLEDKVGNVKVYGDAFVRYMYQKGFLENDDSWDYRFRIRTEAQVNDRTKVTWGGRTAFETFSRNGTPSQPSNGSRDFFTDLANVDGERSYGWQYAEPIDGIQLKYHDDRLAITGGYGKFKEGRVAGSTPKDGLTYGSKYGHSADGTVGLDGVKTAYGEIEGFFGGGSAADSSIGLYYNDFTVASGNHTGDQFNADGIWGAYAYLNFGHHWNALVDYEHVMNHTASAITGEDSADVWIGRLTYGKAQFAVPKSWDAWVEYIQVEDGGFINGFSTYTWRFNDYNNVRSWGIGVDYIIGKNVMLGVMQSFVTKTKSGHTIPDPHEQSLVHIVFNF